MNIHEYQAKNILKKYHIPVPNGYLFKEKTSEKEVSSKITNNTPFAIKAQLHTGGRGKGGGIKIEENIQNITKTINNMIGKSLTTHQTGSKGKIIRKIWVEKAYNIKRELYLAILLNSTEECYTIMISPKGGVDIEEVSKEQPNSIFYLSFKATQIPWNFQIKKLLSNCNIKKEHLGTFINLIKNLISLAIKEDTTLIEINPLVITNKNEIIALDAKINFDDNSIKRHPDIKKLEDPEEMDSLERQAKKNNLNYIHLKGNIGTMVNGAGLAMATMDMIKAAGSNPANFLDVGGGASEDMIKKGFEIILKDPNVTSIFVNIFGGILRCDVLAKGIVQAIKSIKLNIPLIIRLEGTNVEEGRKFLNDSNLKFEIAYSLEEAVNKIAQQH